MVILANMAYIQDNHKFIFRTPLSERLYDYLKNSHCINDKGYKHAINCILNLSSDPEWFERTDQKVLQEWIELIIKYENGCYLGYILILFILMVIDIFIFFL